MRRIFLTRVASGFLLAAAAGLGGCAEETNSILDPLPNRAFNFIMTREGTNVPRGTVVTTRATAAAGGAVTSLSVNLQGLEVLRDPYHYQVWIATHTAATNTLSNFQPFGAERVITVTTDTTISAEGDFVPRTVTDTVFSQPGTFNRGGPGTLVTLQATAATLTSTFATAAAGTSRVLLVTIDSNPASPTTPDSVGSQARLWSRGVNTLPAPGGSRTAALQFGNFHADPAQEYVFVAAGRGRGAVLEGENILIVNDSNLSRPPRGYFYATALVTRADGDNFNNIDTIPLGPQTAPFPRRNVSLFNADVEKVDEVVQVERPNPQIFAAHTRVDGDSVPGLAAGTNPFRGVALVLVTLESKFGTEAVSPVIILAGAAPAGIRLRD